MCCIKFAFSQGEYLSKLVDKLKFKSMYSFRFLELEYARAAPALLKSTPHRGAFLFFWCYGLWEQLLASILGEVDSRGGSPQLS